VRGLGQRPLRLVLLGLVAVAAALIGLLAYSGRALDSLELSTIDTRFSIHGAQGAPSDIVIVGVDSATEQAFGPRVPRRFDAAVIDRLRLAGARAIGVDLQFTTETDPADDNALINAAQRARGIVLATTLVDANGHTNVFGGDSELHKIGAHPGNASLLADSDGLFRRVLYVEQKLLTFPVVLAQQVTHHPIPPSEFPGGSAPIDFPGPPGTVTAVSFLRVYHKQLPRNFFRGKVVIVGATAADEQDLHYTGVSNGRPMTGPELQADMLETVLRGNPLRDAPGALNTILIVLFAVAAPLASLRLKPALVFGLAATLGVVYAVVTQLMFNDGTILAFVYPLLSLVLGTVGSNAADLVVERQRRESLETTLARLPSDAASDFFICYRRGESSWPARILRDELARRFGESSVFMDLDSIDAGQEWPRRIENEISGCGVILVLMGPRWLEATESDGTRRIDDPGDWVRLEIEAGLREAEAIVVPVLLDGAIMPDEDELPASIGPLARRHAITLDANHWSTEIGELVDSIRNGRIRDFLVRAREKPEQRS
jgi:CHASE2 domain-containing sensor protein